MRVVCPGWLRTHATPICIVNDKVPDGKTLVAMCPNCRQDYNRYMDELETKRAKLLDQLILQQL